MKEVFLFYMKHQSSVTFGYTKLRWKRVKLSIYIAEQKGIFKILMTKSHGTSFWVCPTTSSYTITE